MHYVYFFVLSYSIVIMSFILLIKILNSFVSTLYYYVQKYMEALAPFLVSGLENYEAFQVCAIVVGLIGDICRSIEADITIYCNNIMNGLVRLLQDPHLHRSVKPPVLSCFGDIAMAIGASFEPFLKMCIFMLASASNTQVPPDDEELVEYLQLLREGILEAYTGIIQGLKDGNRIQLLENKDVEGMISLLEKIANEADKDEEVVSKSVGLLGYVIPSFSIMYRKEYKQISNNNLYFVSQ